MEDTLLQLKNSLEKMEKEVGAKVAELEGSTKATSEEITKAKTVLEAVQKELKELQEHVKERKINSLPGLNEGKEKFSIQMYVQAMHKSALREADPWKYSGIEKEALDNLMKQRASHTTEASDSLGYLVPEEVSSGVVKLAIADMPIMNLGVTVFSGLHGDFSVPKMTQRNTAYWLGENTKPTESSAKIGKIFLRRKKVGAFAKVTKDLVYQSRGVADAFITESLKDRIALEVHDKLLNGTGTDYQPKGILAYTSGFTSYTEATNGTQFKFDHAAKMLQNLEEADELKDTSKGAYLTRPIVKWGLRRQTVAQFSGQSAADALPIIGTPFIMSDTQLEGLLGYPMKSTSQISKTLSKGSSTTCSAVIFGDWKRFAIGMWRDFEIKVSDIAGDGSTGSAFLDDEMYIVCFQSIDCNFLRQTAFVVTKDCETTNL